MLLLRLRSRAEPLARRVPQKSTPWVCVSAASVEDSILVFARVHLVDLTRLYDANELALRCSWLFFVASQSFSLVSMTLVLLAY